MRFTRLTNAFGKWPEIHEFSINFPYFNYNFIRKHETTQAAMADMTDKAWTMIDFVGVV